MVMLHRMLWHLASDVRAPLIRGVSIGWLLFGIRVAQAIVLGFVLGAVLDFESSELVLFLPILVMLLVARGLLVWGREKSSQTSAVQIKIQLRERLIHQLIKLGPAYLSAQRTGAVQSAVVDGIEGLEAYYSKYLPQLIIALTGSVFVVSWMIY